MDRNLILRKMFPILNMTEVRVNTIGTNYSSVSLFFALHLSVCVSLHPLLVQLHLAGQSGGQTASSGSTKADSVQNKPIHSY